MIHTLCDAVTVHGPLLLVCGDQGNHARSEVPAGRWHTDDTTGIRWPSTFREADPLGLARRFPEHTPAHPPVR